MKTGTKIDFYPIGKPEKLETGKVMAAVGENQYKVVLPNGKVKLIDTVGFIIQNYSTIKLVLEFIIKLIKQLKPGDRAERKIVKREIRKTKAETKRQTKKAKKLDENY
jgi:hypothetical protein